MKKLLIFLAALSFVACSKNDIMSDSTTNMNKSVKILEVDPTTSGDRKSEETRIVEKKH